MLRYYRSKLHNYLSLLRWYDPIVLKDFIEFLKKKDVLEQFNNNLPSRKRFSRTSGYGNLIDHAFCWADTYEGHIFWSDLSTEWEKHCFKKRYHQVKQPFYLNPRQLTYIDWLL